ncbi:unnamed protein product [Parnassius mnemosyne]|uniref:Histone-lysine N-methyltransferase SETMAR n=1 Tax=Parnassius mnemosyne TaxID=213953 RepID=A0AAV1LM20_9NEOP
MLRLFLLRDKERLMQNGMLAFVCHRSFLNSVKRTATAASSSITTMRVLTPHTEQKFLEQENIELLDHPPYSPDLSPNDFYTFPKIKNKLGGQRFSSPEEAVDAYKTAILETPTSEWNGCFND